MVQSTSPSIEGQVEAVRDQLAQQMGLPFLDVLSAAEVESTCRASNHKWRTRIYTPWITLNMFLAQILLSPDEYAAMPKELELREIRVRIQDKKKRTRVLVIVTTLLDATKYPASELADLFRQRWHAELDIRSIKTTMGTEMLRAKTPDMVRKEVGMHLLAYNLIRVSSGQELSHYRGAT